MSEAAAPTATLAPDASPSYMRDVIGRVLRQWGPRIGLTWVGLLVFLAVFAPFIATSHPLLEKRGGVWSSPVIANLSSADVILQCGFWSALILWRMRFRPGVKVMIWISLLILVGAAAIAFVHAPDLVVYETYRNDLHSGKIERALFAPIPFSPADHLRDMPDAALLAPSRQHWMGTTELGADLLSNLIHATRIALSIGFISTGISAIIGIAVGAVTGYYAGWIDLIAMRIAEIFDAIPTLLLLLCFVAAFPPNLYIIMAIIGATNWVSYAYYVRAEFLSLRDRDFVHAARAAGIGLPSILFRHILLNGLTPVIVSASFGVASAILWESTLSFLGIGLTNETSWGALLEEALSVSGTFSWWIALYPGLAIFLTVFAYNLIGEALRDALDPRIGRMM